MDIATGNLYFVNDSFFEKVKDPFLKINYTETKRPHYLAIKDTSKELFWLVPCSSRVEKYKAIIQARTENGKKTNGIRIVVIQNEDNALLFQDMFPVTEHYIEAPYIRGGQVVRIADPKVILELEKNAKKVLSLIRHGVRFTPTQPDILKIEALLSDEIEN